ATGNQIGGPSFVDPNTGDMYGWGNLISGNSFDGVFLAASSGGTAPVTKNLVQGNVIGVDVTGMRQLANAGNGVHLEGGAQDNTIGGTNPTLRNVISGNGTDAGQSQTSEPIVGAGVQIADFFGTGPVSGNVVEGNYIGIDRTGRTVNGTDGVTLGNLHDG